VIPPPPSTGSGLILLGPRPVPEGYRRVETLSRTGDLSEVAHHLFEVLRRLDRESLDAVVAELPPEEGIGRAIADRLRRAAARD
jgi:L-threonylcarbamoyladenylate synthase